MSGAARIVVVSSRLDRATLAQLSKSPFDGMVKFVVDVELGRMAVGGSLHADGEALLLEQGSEQGSLWGGNYFPGRPAGEYLEFQSLINIRPAQRNRSMLVEDPGLRERIRTLVHDLLGHGEALG